MDGPDRQCPSCGASLPRPVSRHCPACGGIIERRSADRPPPQVWRWRRLGLILAALVGAVVIGGGVAMLAGQGPPWGMGAPDTADVAQTTPADPLPGPPGP